MRHHVWRTQQRVNEFGVQWRPPSKNGKLLAVVRAQLNEPRREAQSQKKAMVRTSMLSRMAASTGLVGSSNAECPMKRHRPSVQES